MQGQQDSVSSLLEGSNCEMGSTSSGAVVDQQVGWTAGRNDLAENGLQIFMTSANNTDITYLNAISHEQPEFSRWSLGEASSSGTKNEVNEDISSSSNAGLTLEERQTDNTYPDPMSLQCLNTQGGPPNINLNEEFIFHGEDAYTQHVEHPNSYLSSRPNYEQDSIPRGFSEGCRASCKRKAIDGNVGESSSSADCTHHEPGESSTWPSHTFCDNPGNGFSISGPPEQASMMEESQIPDCSVQVVAGSSHRNCRMRFSPSNQQEHKSLTTFPAASDFRQPDIQHSPRLLQAHHRSDTRMRSALENLRSQSQNVTHVQALPTRMQPIHLRRSSTLRIGSASSSSMSVDHGVEQLEDIRARGSENMPDSLLLIPPPVLSSSSRASSDENAGMPGIAASASRVSSATGVQPSQNMNRLPHHIVPPHYPRRFSELARRSLLSSLASEPINPRSDQSIVRSASLTSPEMAVLSNGAGDLSNHRTQLRTAYWLERAHSLRALAAASGGRSRLVASEIRNVLDYVRRRENLWSEDVMFLDHYGFSGDSDIHDRYRDMQLDVDNMSYEELLALEERIGDVCTGLSEETILKLLKQRKHTTTGDSCPRAESCCVCQEEYSDGEDIGTLECEHDFHTECIKLWLKRKNLCPICKQTGLNTLEKTAS